MFTHLYVTRDDAGNLFKEFASKPLSEGQSGVVTRATLDAHFAEFGETYLRELGAALAAVPSEGLFVLKFGKYLAHLPQEFARLEVLVVRAEILRMNSALTQARAGYYEDTESGLIATVERVFPTTQRQDKGLTPLYVQNIMVSGPSLSRVQDFNTGLSCGHYEHFLVNAFE